MTKYTDRELTTLLRGPESETVERKRSRLDRTGIRRNICAFANDLAGRGIAGVIFVGVEDDGTCAGIDVDDQLLRILGQMRSDGAIFPLPLMSVDKKVLDGCELAVVTVQPSITLPVRFQGQVWIKVGPTVQAASPDEEHHLAERYHAADLPFDHWPSNATLADLDLAFIEQTYLPKAVAQEVLEQNQRTIDDQLYSLRLTTRDQPTRGALIAFGKYPRRWSPGAFVQFLRLDGEDLTAPIRLQARLSGRLDEVLQRLDQLIRLAITGRTDITSGLVEVSSPDYPRTAIRQLMHNAVLHRTYETEHAPVRLYWFSNRIEIQSPGGLYGNVTSANIGTGETAYRNPLLAEIMHHLGFARNFGMGLPVAKKAMEANGNPPLEFDFSPTRVIVRLRPAP